MTSAENQRHHWGSAPANAPHAVALLRATEVME
jgi:hypothetical protein